jgi:hypothetical protein
LGIVEPGVGEVIRQMAFSLSDVVDEAIEVGTAPTTGGYGAGSTKDQLLAAIARESDVRRMPLVDLPERDFTGLVVRIDALDDLRHGLVPLPAARHIQGKFTKDSVMSLILRSLYHTLGTFPLKLDSLGVIRISPRDC